MRASLSSAYDPKLGDTVGSDVRVKTALSGGRRLDTSLDKKLNRSVLSDGHRESRNASVLTPRAERQKIMDYMEGLPYDKRYGFKPVKLLGQYNRESDLLMKPWKNAPTDPSVGRNTMIDFI